MTDLQKVATLVAKRRQSNKQTINKVAKLVAQGRAQNMVKQAGMQKTALIGVGKLEKILKNLGPKRLQARLFNLDPIKAAKRLGYAQNFGLLGKQYELKDLARRLQLNYKKGLDIGLTQHEALNLVKSKRVQDFVNKLLSRKNTINAKELLSTQPDSFQTIFRNNGVKDILAGTPDKLKSLGGNISAGYTNSNSAIKDFIAGLKEGLKNG